MSFLFQLKAYHLFSTKSLPESVLTNCQSHPWKQILVNSLWPKDAIWQQTLGSTLAHVTACWLTVPCHYLNQCWVIISEVLWHSSEANFTGDVQGIYPWYEFENYKFKITVAPPRGQWVNHHWDIYLGDAGMVISRPSFSVSPEDLFCLFGFSPSLLSEAERLPNDVEDNPKDGPGVWSVRSNSTSTTYNKQGVQRTTTPLSP